MTIEWRIERLDETNEVLTDFSGNEKLPLIKSIIIMLYSNSTKIKISLASMTQLIYTLN
jgi:hypothetical protein